MNYVDRDKIEDEFDWADARNDHKKLILIFSSKKVEEEYDLYLKEIDAFEHLMNEYLNELFVPNSPNRDNRIFIGVADADTTNMQHMVRELSVNPLATYIFDDGGTVKKSERGIIKAKNLKEICLQIWKFSE